MKFSMLGTEKTVGIEEPPYDEATLGGVPTNPEKSRWERSWPTIACGAGLFSEGYLNGVIGQVNTILKTLYTTQYTSSSAQQNVTSIAFVGTVVGQLFFGWMSDHYSRKWALMASTCILILFAALSAGSYGYHGSITGLFQALTAYRFLLGIGIGGEYPAGSVACAESTGELKAGHRNRWFIMFTNVQIDIGFVMASFIPMILVLIFSGHHLRAAWRVALGLGVIPPLSLFYLRLKLREPEEFTRETMKDTRTPWRLVIRYYWFRLLIVSLIWFIYDFSAYSFSIYSSAWLAVILGKSAPLWKTFGWNTIINLFYLPGAVGGAFLSDWIGPRYALAIGVFLQGIVGFIMAGVYATLDTPAHVAGFVVVYGIFLSLGEAGPGDNIGLVASKTCATAVRGQYYALAAAFGKIGAFVGTYVFPLIQDHAPGGANSVRGGQDPFFVSSALCIFSAALALFLLPHIGQDTITTEDVKFRAYLETNGWDTRRMGTKNSVPIAIIGGTGLSSLPSPPFTPLAVLPPTQTPWGTPSSSITILSYTPPPDPSASETSSNTSPNPSSSPGDNGSKPTTIAFLARHGTHHEYAPHEVNNRANVAALRKLGVRCAVGFSAVGSLREEVKPRDFVVGEQVVDWTKGVRPWTFFEGGVVGHIPFADPFDKQLSAVIVKAVGREGVLEGHGVKLHEKGTIVCIEGPQFSTRAESVLYRTAFAADIINMSATPECKLFREAEIAYALLCMSTDYDSWHPANETVSVDMVMGHMGANARNAKRAVEAVLGELSGAEYEAVRQGRTWRGGSRASAGITKAEGREREVLRKLEWLFPGEWDSAGSG